jgi:C-terminal processing protease CtpA/Prc
VALNTPASRALLQEGDVILAINNIDIRNHTHGEIINMIRHTHEIELLIEPFDRRNSLEDSLEQIRKDISSNRLTEQYEVS